MFGNLLALLVIVVLAVLSAWLVRRAARARHGYIKWPGMVLGGAFTLIFGLLAVAGAIGMYRMYSPAGSPVTALKVAGTPEQIARGQHLANSLCVSCHTPTGELPLSGGRDIGADLPLPFGNFISSNLTPGGPLKNWSDGEILRVLREGVDRDGRVMLVMSANGVRYLSEDDKQAVIAYLRSQPAVSNNLPDPPDQPSLLLAIMAGSGLVQPQAPVGTSITAPPKAATPAYGKYVVDYFDCRLCHGKDLAGGIDPTQPKGPSLRVVQGWTREQFVATLRTGKDPGGHELNSLMPWQFVARLDDEEISAMHAYLLSLPPASAE